MGIMSVSKKQEQQWQAEEDARTLGRYQEIRQDKARMSRATREAEKQAKDLSKRASIMQNAAKSKTSNRTSRKK
jgi:hypothetical protein